MTHGPTVGLDAVNGLVLHENDTDWHPWLDPEPYAAKEEGTRHAEDDPAYIGRYGREELRFEPRPGYSQSREDYA